MNLWAFTGNLGKDCELKTTQGGTTVCEFSVAVTSGYGDKKKTTWARCSLFGKKAESKLPEYLNKGTKVAVTGEVTLEEWESKGVPHAALKVSVNTIDLIGDKQEPKATPQSEEAKSSPAPSQAASGGFDSFDDDIPFN